MSKIPKSMFGRGAKLLSLASKMALEEASSRLKTWETEKEKLKSKIELAQDLVKTLSELKGASMKLGQLLSLDLGDYLPPEMTKILEQLHHKSTFLSFSDIEKIGKEELGEKFYDLKDFTTTPIAAASIGQVHKANLDGKEVVVKVQYPGVAESIPSDIKILELLLKNLNFLMRKDADLKPFLNEMKEVLLKEADYQHELLMHQRYKEKLQDSPYIIPEIYPEYCTGNVLTLEYIEGKTLTEWLSGHPTVEEKLTLADLMLKLYLQEIFIHGLVQTDPNPGNFLITKDSKLALLDFGAVKEYSLDFVNGYRKILLAAFTQDHQQVLEASFRMGFLDERENLETRKIYLDMMDFLASPFRQNEKFDFNDKSFFEQSRDLSWALAKSCQYSPPPKDLLFLHRKLGGVFSFIKKMNLQMSIKSYWSYVENL